MRTKIFSSYMIGAVTCCLLSCIVLSAPLPDDTGSSSVGLAGLIALTISNNVEHMEYADEIRTADLALKDDIDALWPTLQLGYNHSRQYYLEETTGRYSMNVGASYPLRDGGRRRMRVSYDRRRIDSLDIRLKILRQSLEMDVFQKYIDLLTQTAGLRVYEQAVARAENYAELMRLQFEAGEGIRLDVLSADAHLLKVRSELQELEDRIEITRAKLLAPAGLKADTMVEIVETRSADVRGMSLDEAVKLVEHRLELQLLMMEISLSEQQEQLAVSETRPQLNLLSGYQFSGRDMSFGDNAWRIGMSVTYDLGNNRSLSSSMQQDHSVEDRVFPGGIYSTTLMQRDESLTLNLHNGSSKAPGIFEAKAAVERTEMDFAAKRLQYESEIREAYLMLRRDGKLIEALESDANAKQEALKAHRAEQELGLSQATDVIEAENELVQSLNTAANARFSRLLHERLFLCAIGREPFPEFAPARGDIDDPQGLLKK